MAKQQLRQGGLVFSTIDRFGNPVVLMEGQWDHIKHRHPEMAPFLQEIKETIEVPDGWTVSTSDECTACYQSIGIGPEGVDVRVFVGYATRNFETGSDRGMVKTAYPPTPGAGSKIHRMRYLKGNI